ncbi:energy transducer TonB [Tunturibacter empetritectus]|uniref:TonB C-terminal domain-containing protein n=1 Tax=Tunturiibacter lichenicola TaxID=2051959 RepID=A0A7W8JB81_9BACT|nr:energy transducer TonB [Edaphobacter lichenicola]MBB5346073.1 hypothetical protein [Edaphobacter lichenicola]
MNTIKDSRTLCLLLLFWLIATGVRGQVSHCGGFTSVRERKAPLYPPIAKAARVQEIVILMLTFDLDGNVVNTVLVSGPPMLVASATASAQSLEVNPYTGPRTCPYVVTYRLASEGEDTESYPPPSDIQHVTVMAIPLILSDPAVYIKRRRFLGIF